MIWRVGGGGQSREGLPEGRAEGRAMGASGAGRRVAGADGRRTGAEGKGALFLLLLLVSLESCEGLPEVIKLGQSSHEPLAKRE